MKKTRELRSAPLEDEVEVTLLGPSYGESIVVHVGDGGWIIVDSCIDDAGNPQALNYLLGMGVDAAEAVELVVATHWHDDHIRGMNELVDACQKAEFCCAGAFRQREFLAAIHTLDGRGSFAGGSGVGELQRVFTTLVEQGRIPNFVRADVRIRTTRTCEIWSLSPHNSEFVRFLKAIAPLFPKKGDTKTRVPDVSPNNVAVVLWIRVGEIVILLGADLEANGWVKIVGSTGRPQMRGTAFKVPHHGGASAHEPSVWRAMLEDDPVAVLTPWRLAGRALPTRKDMLRILSETGRAYATTDPARKDRPRKRRMPAVERTMRQSNIKLRGSRPHSGGVRLRRRMNTEMEWKVTLFEGASHLRDLVA